MGDLCAAICRSRSFASDLHNMFSPVPRKEASDELLKQFEYNYSENSCSEVKALPLSELPSSEYIKHGYFLIKDVQAYETRDESDCWFDGFYEYLTPSVYAAMVQNEAKFGRPEEKTDVEGVKNQPRSASDYMFYSYADYYCREYEAHIIKKVAYILSDYAHLPKDAELYVIETEG